MQSRHALSPRLAAVMAAAAVALAPVALAQNEPASQPAASPVVLAVEHDGLSSMFPDQKDAALRRALQMLPARLRELPAEGPDLAKIPQPVIELVISLLEQPGRMALTYDMANQAGGGFGVGLVMSVGPMERQAADAIQGRIGALMAMGNMPAQPVPSQQYAGMSEMYLPFGTVRFGPRDAGAGKWRYEIHAGAMHDADAPFANLTGARDGFTPVLRGRLDFGPLAPLGQQLVAMFAAHDPDAAEGLHMLEQYGLIGENAVSVSFAFGHTPTHSVERAVVHGMRQFAAGAGVSTEPLGPDALRMVPADAVMGGVKRIDLASLRRWIDMALAADPNAAAAMDQAVATTGVHPVNDVLAAIGDTFGWYMADSTGGGGLGSVVGFVALKDAEKFAHSNSRLVEFANAMLAQSDAKGHVAMREWRDNDARLFTLTFPGLPIPAEVTYCMSGRWLLAGLTPQAVIAASRQAAGRGDAGLTACAAASGAFAQQRALTSVSFVDTNRTIRDGYALTSMIGSAVSNLVRSPLGADRDPGLIVPPYRDLVAGAKPIVSISYWDGDDLVMESTGDRSMLVNGAGVIGAASPWFPVIGALIGAGAAAQERKKHDHEDWEPGWEEGAASPARPAFPPLPQDAAPPADNAALAVTADRANRGGTEG